MREFIRMDCLLALALLLAGCAPAPKPEAEVTLVVDESASTIAERLENERTAHLRSLVALQSRRKEVEALERQRDELLVQAKRMDAAFRGLEMVAAKCLGTVNPDGAVELGRQQTQQITWVDVRDLQPGAISVRVSDKKHITIHHDGGSWCNVWADDKGIHWEACK